jgi:hypothetical protein
MGYLYQQVCSIFKFESFNPYQKKAFHSIVNEKKDDARKAREKITTGRLQRQNGRLQRQNGGQFYNKRGKTILIYTTERF